MSTNPNNCSTCDYSTHSNSGWCYMFREEPKEFCHQHTHRARQDRLTESILKFQRHMIANSKNLEPEFEKILNDHFWELLEDDTIS